jgi:hypothetical protein
LKDVCSEIVVFEFLVISWLLPGLDFPQPCLAVSRGQQKCQTKKSKNSKITEN